MSTTTTTNGTSITDAKSSLIQLGQVRHVFEKFLDYLGQQGKFDPPPIVDGLDGYVVQKIQGAYDNISQAFDEATKNAKDALPQITKLGEFLPYARSFGSDFKDLSIAMPAIVTAFKNDPKDSDKKDAVVQMLKAYQDTAITLKQQADELLKAFNAEHADINDAISKIKTAMQTFEDIGKSNGDKLNISKLSQADLKAALDKKIANLNDDISSLEKKFGGSVAGAVAGGAVGVVVAVSNFWNPIGWVAGLGVVFGEVFGGLAIAKLKDQLDSDQEALRLTQEEEKLLKPLYNCQKIVAKLQLIVNELTTLSGTLATIDGDFGAYLNNLKQMESSTVGILVKMKWDHMANEANDIMMQMAFFEQQIPEFKAIPIDKLKIVVSNQ